MPSNTTTGSAPRRTPNRLLPAGPGAALVTLRTPNGDIDTKAMTQLATRTTSHGATMVLVAGTTGEAHQCTPSELIRLTATAANTGAPTITGIPTSARAHLLTSLRNAGATAGLAHPGPHLAAQIDAAHTAELPLMAYHHPSRGITLSLHEAATAATYGLTAIKDSSGDPAALAAFLTLGIPVYVGGTPMLAHARTAGAAGLLSGLGSAHPELVARAWHGDTAASAILTTFEHQHPARISALKTAARTLIAHPVQY